MISSPTPNMLEHRTGYLALLTCHLSNKDSCFETKRACTNPVFILLFFFLPLGGKLCFSNLIKFFLLEQIFGTTFCTAHISFSLLRFPGWWLLRTKQIFRLFFSPKFIFQKITCTGKHSISRNLDNRHDSPSDCWQKETTKHEDDGSGILSSRAMISRFLDIHTVIIMTAQAQRDALHTGLCPSHIHTHTLHTGWRLQLQT